MRHSLPVEFSRRSDWPGAFRFHYPVRVITGGLIASAFSISFLDPLDPSREMAAFRGLAGGLTLGLMDSEGTAEFFVPVEVMQGWSADFRGSGGALGAGRMVFDFHAKDGRGLGAASVISTGFGVAAFGGSGSFDFAGPFRIESDLGETLGLSIAWSQAPAGRSAPLPVVLAADPWNSQTDLWTLVEAGNGHFLFLAEDDMALEIPDGDDRPGAPLQVSKRTGGDNQHWFFARRPDPDSHTMLIVNKQSQLAIDVDGGRAEPGTKVQQWPAAGNANQRWRFAALARRS